MNELLSHEAIRHDKTVDAAVNTILFGFSSAISFSIGVSGEYGFFSFVVTLSGFIFGMFFALMFANLISLLLWGDSFP